MIWYSQKSFIFQNSRCNSPSPLCLRAARCKTRLGKQNTVVPWEEGVFLQPSVTNKPSQPEPADEMGPRAQKELTVPARSLLPLQEHLAIARDFRVAIQRVAEQGRTRARRGDNHEPGRHGSWLSMGRENNHVAA